MVEEKIPKHIAFIPDGNRTWARINNIPYKEAYEKGISKIGDILEWCMEKGIKTPCRCSVTGFFKGGI